jgi:hypothetical protein
MKPEASRRVFGWKRSGQLPLWIDKSKIINQKSKISDV